MPLTMEQLDNALGGEMTKGKTGDKICVTYGEETFSPIQYHSFKIGPFQYTTQIQEGETAEVAATRAYAFLTKLARATYSVKSKEFQDRAQGRVK